MTDPTTAGRRRIAGANAVVEIALFLPIRIAGTRGERQAAKNEQCQRMTGPKDSTRFHVNLTVR
jgi:hypothetical protein